MELPEYPVDLQRRAEILWNNSFGFQAPGWSGDYFVIAREFDVDIEDNILLEEIKRETGAMTIEAVDFIGRDFLKIHWTEYPFIEAVLTAFLKRGIGFSLHLKIISVGFDPKKRDTEFSQEILEKKVIEDFKAELKGVRDDQPYRYVYENYCYKKSGIAHEWCWQTAEGKAFCRELRINLGKREICSGKYDFTKWGIFQNYDPRTLLTKEVEEAEQGEECMVCFDKIANTVVLPCEHCVVCKECSVRLRDTNDAQRCLRCRRIITQVLE